MPAEADATPSPTRTESLPALVYVLGFTIFLLGTGEFVVAGLLPYVSADLNQSIAHVGFLVSAFAIGMVVGAPAMAVLTVRLPNSRTLLISLGIFVVANVVAAMAPSYSVLLVSRLIAAGATGGFWAAATVVAARSVRHGLRLRALAVLAAGLVLSNVAGVPGGTYLGELFGWRIAFWILSGGAVVAAAVLFGVVRPGAAEPSRDLHAELRAFRSPRLWVALTSTALFNGGVFGTYTYISPLLTDVAGVPTNLVAAVLLAFGLGAGLGVWGGGRLGDRYPRPLLLFGLGASGAVLLLLVLLSPVTAAACVLVALLGVVAFSVLAPLNAWVLDTAGDAPTVASATNSAAMNVGNLVGSALGGIAISSAAGLRSPAALGTAMLACAFLLAVRFGTAVARTR